MTERRPFPPSPRRHALARQAGLTAASPVVVGAVACIGAVIAAVFLARAAGALIGGWIAAACRSATGQALIASSSPDVQSSATGESGVLAIDRLSSAVIELALPLVVAAAIAAIVAHIAQTRALWLPRRRIDGAPSLPPARIRHTAFDMLAAIVIALVAFAWLWLTAPRLAQLFATEHTLAGVGSAIASLVIALAVAWVVLGAIDALLRRAELTNALAMTRTEKREDDRLAAADPRWRAQRAALARGPSASEAVGRAALLLLGDDVAVAIAWDPRRTPVPLRTATGRGPRATQLLGLARRHRIAVHRDAQLAAQLDGEGPVPDAHWARLAEIIAAVQGANTGPNVPA